MSWQEAYNQMVTPIVVPPPRKRSLLDDNPNAELVRTILYDALEIVWKAHPANPRKWVTRTTANRTLYIQARAWLDTKGPGDGEFYWSFEDVCSYLNLDPDCVRKMAIDPERALASLRKDSSPLREGDDEQGGDEDEDAHAV